MEIDSKFHELISMINNEKYSEYSRSIKLAEKLFTYFVDTEQVKYLQKLISLSVIIKSYPKRIIKKGTKSQSGTQFDASIMCLLNYNCVKFSSVEIRPFLCKSNTKELLKHKLLSSLENPNFWIIKNMRWQSKDGTRSSRRSTCDKNVILFEFIGDYQSRLLSEKLITNLYSDTLVIVVHSNQEVDSLMTLFWDDYYREGNSNFDLLNFNCRNQSYINELIENLSDFFKKETDRPLTENNKIYLLQKIRDIFPSSEVITSDDFMKISMPNAKLSFGQWIMSIIKMLKIPTLEKMWRNNCIEGFIAKEVKTILHAPGSFLLRFSERQPAIGVVRKSDNNETEPWDPYTDVHLRGNNLASLLYEYPHLLSLRLSNGQVLSRDEALQPFMDPIKIDDGYTRRGGNELSYERQDSEMEYQESHTISEDSDFNSNVDINELYENCEIILNDMKVSV